jgi:hypothetical protein
VIDTYTYIDIDRYRGIDAFVCLFVIIMEREPPKMYKPSPPYLQDNRLGYALGYYRNSFDDVVCAL